MEAVPLLDALGESPVMRRSFELPAAWARTPSYLPSYERSPPSSPCEIRGQFERRDRIKRRGPSFLFSPIGARVERRRIAGRKRFPSGLVDVVPLDRSVGTLRTGNLPVPAVVVGGRHRGRRHVGTE